MQGQRRGSGVERALLGDAAPPPGARPSPRARPGRGQGATRGRQGVVERRGPAGTGERGPGAVRQREAERRVRGCVPPAHLGHGAGPGADVDLLGRQVDPHHGAQAPVAQGEEDQAALGQPPEGVADVGEQVLRAAGRQDGDVE
ncbi:Uncharacterised protein [Streptococcus pneumoniae]|nr:Uncharacterised protein [Streptococcus pneumoniae]